MRPGTNFLVFLQKNQFSYIGCLFGIILEVRTVPWGNTSFLKKPFSYSATFVYQFYKPIFTIVNLLRGI